ncbi:ABC transporter substrate-binding protein [Rhizobium sp. YJ-22]|uniref:ABC transporter substrate-binding protein n=1 Tax=Rhizobium sp. YJ-22 TaxID=3037556 RepID=UPI002412DCD9|nr:ABC transporter substrate-binding protein [Rhizobium sp. YJ-22]MDG3576749.1 ABC transporter substrate-binding protein [Rhizobium sp. YJ-22]
MSEFETAHAVAQGFVTGRRAFLRGALAIGAASVMPLRLGAQTVSEGVLIFGNAEPPTSNYWDPAAGFGLVDEQVASLVHDSLLSFDAEGKIGPGLATAWTVKDDRTVALTLREGVAFHDGAPVTAEDVKATIDKLGEGQLAQSMVVVPGITVKITSPTEVEVVSPVAFGVVLNALAFIKILPKKNIDNPDNFKIGALGSGPYRFVSYSGNDVTLEANDSWWGGAPKIKTVIFRYIEDAEARINALLTGQVDILTRVNAEFLSRVEGNADFHVNNQSPPSQIVGLMQHNGPLGDVKLRQAVAHAIDREGIAASVMRGLNPVNYSALPTTSSFYEPLEPKFEYNPERARELIAQSSHADGVTLRLATTTLVPNQLEIDQIIAASLKQVGISVEVERLEVGAYRSSYNTYDMTLDTLAIFNHDPDFVLGTYIGAAAEQVFHLKDEKFEALHAAQRAATVEDRPAAVRAAAQYLWENQITFFLTDEIWYSIVNNRVKDYTRAPLVGENLVPRASRA